jgi:sugar transferase (PEP-CTERM system associated)
MRKRLMLGDAILAVLAVYAGHAIRSGAFPASQAFFTSYGPKTVLFAAVVTFASLIAELYRGDRNPNKKEILLGSALSSAMAFFLLSAIYYLMPFFSFIRGALVISLAVFASLQALWHMTFRLFVNLPALAQRVLILGTGALANQMGTVLLGRNHSHVLSGYVNCASEPVLVPPQSVVGNGEGLVETVKRARAHKLVVSLSERRGVFPLKDVLSCKLNGIDVVDAPSFYEQMTGKLLVENITPSWFIFSDGFRVTTYKKVFKRTFDSLLAWVFLVVSLPLMLLIALAIVIDSRGPVFYKQVRLGQGERKFVLYKFRTMKKDAESGTGAVWSQAGDPRITRVGGFLRKTRLDEIPQLYNVLTGTMSFVGPRPERPEFIQRLNEVVPFYSERHSIKPGITGWAQIKYPYGASVEDSIEKLRYDLYYIKHFSLFLDLLIIMETVKVVLFGRGGR